MGVPNRHVLTAAISFAFLIGLLLPPTAQAHSGGPYPVLLEEPAGPYVVSVLADPDVGVGTFIVQAVLSGGGTVPADTEVTLWVRPQDGHAPEAGYRARRQQTRDGEAFVAGVPFDAEGVWQVRLVLEGTAGRGETTFNVRATPPGRRWLTAVLCLLPFIGLGALWLVAVLRSPRRPRQIPSSLRTRM